MTSIATLQGNADAKMGIRHFVVSFLLTTAYLVTLCIWFDPIWETNDDVAMAMVVHGYGFASHGSSHLLFSNVIWGHIVRGLDGMFGLQGYSVGTLGVLFLSGWSYLYFLGRLGVSYSVRLPAVGAILSWPIIFPQFTTNAGLVTVAAVLGSYSYTQTRDRLSLAISCMLAMIGFLIRSLEFVLVVAVAAPFLPWRLLCTNRGLQISFAAVLLAMLAAQTFNSMAYQSSDWQTFDAKNLARAPYTDFGVGSRLKERPDILEKYGYSENDIDLISNWFFEDPTMFQPYKLNEMVQALGPSLGPLSASQIKFAAGLDALAQLFSPRVLALTVSALALLLLTLRLRLAISWAIAVAVVSGLGLVGAQVHGRVLFPVVALLVIMAVALSLPITRQLMRVALPATMLAAFAYAVWLLLPLAAASRNRIEVAQAQFSSLGGELTFVWGDGLDFEATYPVKLSPRRSKSGPPLYALGVMTHAPFSVASQQAKQGHGLIERLRSPSGINIMLADPRLQLLENYCEQNLGATLRISDPDQARISMLRRLNCARSVVTK